MLNGVPPRGCATLASQLHERTMTTLCLNNANRSMTVEQLVRTAQNGCPSAFGELVRRFEGAVYGTALRQMGDPLEAEELAQEVFLRAFQKLAQLRDPLAFGGWLRAMTRRMAINRMLRRRVAVATAPEVLEATCADATSPLDQVLASERSTEVHAGLNRLSAMDRQTLVAFYLRGESLIEMSHGFAAPIGTIKRRLHVARKRLAEELAPLSEA